MDPTKLQVKRKTPVAAFIHKKAGANANLSYRINGELHYFDLWVTKMTQDHSLTGEVKQGKLSNHFYAKAYTQGNFELTLICSSQKDYQDLAVFVRKHHEVLMDHQGSFDVETINTVNSEKVKKLIQFHFPSEGILCRGFCPSFKITRKGVMEPNPTPTFTFTSVLDRYSPNFRVSEKLHGWFPDPSTEVGIAVVPAITGSPLDPNGPRRDLPSKDRTNPVGSVPITGGFRTSGEQHDPITGKPVVHA